MCFNMHFKMIDFTKMPLYVLLQHAFNVFLLLQAMHVSLSSSSTCLLLNFFLSLLSFFVKHLTNFILYCNIFIFIKIVAFLLFYEFVSSLRPCLCVSEISLSGTNVGRCAAKSFLFVPGTNIFRY